MVNKKDYPNPIANKKMELAHKKTQKEFDWLMVLVEKDDEVRHFVQSLLVKKFMPTNDEIKQLVQKTVEDCARNEVVLSLAAKSLIEDAVNTQLSLITENLQDFQAAMTEKIKKRMGLTIERFDPDVDPDIAPFNDY